MSFSPVASSIVQTNATVKFATAATPTVHQARTKAGKTGMKEVASPLARVSRENNRIDLINRCNRVMWVLRLQTTDYRLQTTDLLLPQISDTIPARKVPTANPEKKIILAMTARLESWQTSWNSVLTVRTQKEVSNL